MRGSIYKGKGISNGTEPLLPHISVQLLNYKEGKGRPYIVSLSSGEGDVGGKKA